jgi:phosphatidylinositol alpha-1,6-mannosyltransferase
VVTPDFPPGQGGIQKLLHGLVSQWDSLDALVVTRDASRSEEVDAALANRPQRMRTIPGLGHRGNVAALNAWAIAQALRFRPDVVLSAHIVVSPAAWAISRLTNVPYVQYLHGSEVVERPRLTRFSIQHSAAVIAVGKYTASLVSSCTTAPLHRLSPGVDLPHERMAERSAQPLIVTVARLAERYKGHDVMLRALPLIRARVPEVQWVVVGDGPSRSVYEQMALDLGVSGQVHFVGAVSDSERDRWLDSARVFAMPSRLASNGAGEGFGIVYLEAAAHSLPVVAGRVGGALDAVEEGVTGLLVDPTDHSAVADAITELLTNVPLAEALGRAGAARAQGFAWPQVARRVQAVLEEVLTTRAA